ncbi:MAG TPA: GntR family transcriptional regulator [Casimicrobiaceae bacterium]|nr:GntR family transcriptional regulator [Casimicrobiaceae bacterium]
MDRERSHAVAPGASEAERRPARHAPAPGATLPSAVAERLREMIIEGDLRPGARLNERTLCERLAVSRTPLREAFRLLAAEGLVELQPNRGAMVVALSEDDIRESFEVMGALEALSGELACARIGDADVAEIKALTYEMLACHARHDLPAYYRLNRAIHDRINLAAGNALLSRTYRTLNQRIQNLRFRSNLDREKWDRAARQHAEIVAALEARDGARLGAILRHHLEHKAEAVLANLRTPEFGDGRAEGAP